MKVQWVAQQDWFGSWEILEVGSSTNVRTVIRGGSKLSENDAFFIAHAVNLIAHAANLYLKGQEK